MQDNIKGTLATKFGEIEFTLTSANHVHLTGAIVVRGVLYSVAYHLFLSNDKWWPKDTMHEPYLSRTGMIEVSLAAKKTVREQLAADWTAYAADHQHLLALGERIKMANEIETKREEVSELQAKLTVSKQELHGMTLKLAMLGGPYAPDA